MWEEHVACMKVMTSNKFLNGKSVRKTPLWRPSRRWHNMIKVDIKKVEVVTWSRRNWLKMATVITTIDFRFS